MRPDFLIDNSDKFRSVRISNLHLNGKQTLHKQVKIAYPFKTYYSSSCLRSVRKFWENPGSRKNTEKSDAWITLLTLWDISNNLWVGHWLSQTAAHAGSIVRWKTRKNNKFLWKTMIMLVLCVQSILLWKTEAHKRCLATMLKLTILLYHRCASQRRVCLKIFQTYGGILETKFYATT